MRLTLEFVFLQIVNVDGQFVVFFSIPNIILFVFWVNILYDGFGFELTYYIYYIYNM